MVEVKRVYEVSVANDKNARKSTVTLLYGARGPVHNKAVALTAFLIGKLAEENS